MTRKPSRPSFFILTRRDCARVLSRNHVGRIAYRNGESVDIEPVGYVAKGDWLYMRSAYGAKLEALAHSPFVAFEVDEIEGPFDWRSVVVHGTIYVLSEPGGKIEQKQYRDATRAIRSAMPGALTLDDPVPERATVYGLHLDHVEGRSAESRPSAHSSRRRRVTKKVPKRRRTPDGF